MHDCEEESKDAFYDQLQVELESTPDHEMKIVMGDLEPRERKDVASEQQWREAT